MDLMNRNGRKTGVERNGRVEHMPAVTSDYPRPRVYEDEREFTWDEGKLAADVVLSAHRDETFHTETEDERLTVRLEKARRRFDGEEATTRYRFVVIDRDQLPEDSGKAASALKTARGRIDRGLKPRAPEAYDNEVDGLPLEGTDEDEWSDLAYELDPARDLERSRRAKR